MRTRGFAALGLGDIRIAVCRRDVEAWCDQRKPPHGVELVLIVDDLDAAHDVVTAASYEVTEPLATQPWGMRDFRICDLGGYYWRVTTIPST